MPELLSAEILASTSPVAFFGYARAKQGCRDELLALMLGLGEPSRSEPGVVAYEIHDDSAQQDAIAFYELYADGAAVQAHLEQPYMREFFAKSQSLLASDLEISILRPIRSRSSVESSDVAAEVQSNEMTAESLIEEVSIDGMCGVY